MTKRIWVETVCTASVFETWGFDVPDDFDLSPDDDVDSIAAAGEFCSVENTSVDNERERETLTITEVTGWASTTS